MILLQNARRVFQQPADLVPDGRVERLDRDQSGIAAELTVEPAAIGAAAPVVTPPPLVVVAREAVAARLTDEQAAQQVPHAREPLAAALSVLLQPFRGIREQRLVHDRRHGHADVLVSRRWNLPEGPLR